MKYFLSIVFLNIWVLSFSQDSISIKYRNTVYISIGDYKEKGLILTKQDSLQFRFRDNDTLVKMPDDYWETQKDMVKVKYEYKDPEFLEKYQEVVFPQDKSTLKIWKQDIKLYFDKSVPEKHREALKDFAYGLSASVDSLNIIEVNNREESNYHVYYTNDKFVNEYESKMANLNSGYYVYWNNRQRINRGFLKVDTRSNKIESYQIANLKYNFFRSLGYFGGSDQLECNSYLSNCRTIRSLVELDLEILKYHYSYGVCKGIRKKDFVDFHSRMHEILAKHPTAELMVLHEK